MLDIYEQDSYANLLQEVLQDIDKAMENPGVCPGLETGITAIDNAIDGLNKGDIIVIGGRPGMGKTALANNIAIHVAKRHHVGFLSLEQPRKQLALRTIADYSGKPVQELRRGLIDSHERGQLEEVVAQLQNRKIVIRDVFKRDYETLHKTVLQLMDLHEIEVVFVDYLQLAHGKNPQSRDREIGQITGNFKALAVELKVPVVLLSQINRSSEKNEDKRPTMANLRESGSIEADADVALLLHREHYYFKQKPKPEMFDEEAYNDWQKELGKVHGKAEVIVAKNRHGESGQVLNLAFDDKRMRFSDLVQEERHYG